MNYFSDQDLLTVWEYGLSHEVMETNLFLLSHAYPTYDPDQIAAFSIGERDARLLQIREKLFGTNLQNTSNCTACGQKMEWETSTHSLHLQPINDATAAKPMIMNYKKHEISFRLVNSRDVLETTGMSDEKNRVDQLIQKCIVKSTLPEHKENIPEDLKMQLIQKMEEKDPQANIVMSVSCPECKHTWNATFDIMHYLWTEINDWAIQLLQDVYLLASTFKWSEKDILEMSRLRRNLYLNMMNR